MIVLHDGDTVRLGDHIVINQSYIDPDTKEDLQGYCGRIVEFKPELRRITVEWDAETQQRFPERTRQWCEDYAEDSTGKTYGFLFSHIMFFSKVEPPHASADSTDQMQTITATTDDES